MVDWSKNPRINYLAQRLSQGGVVAYPTEAVWGLGADPFNPAAVNEILRIKQRPVEKGVILLAADLAQVEFLLEGISPEQREALISTWPGAVTWLIPHCGRVPVWISGQFDTVAVRVTDHPVAQGLARAFGRPIVSTSCNPAGQDPARTQAQAQQYFASAHIDFCSGVVGNRVNPSLICDLTSKLVIRPS
jgi:L-threonylcarbamoyladenylate synthase